MTVGPTVHAHQHALSISPFGFTQGLISAEYEWAKTRSSTWVLQGGFNTSTSNSTTDSTTVVGFGTHSYLSNTVLDGPYIGASGVVVATKSGATGSDQVISTLDLIVSGRAGVKLDFDSIIFDVAVNFSVPMYSKRGMTARLGAGDVSNNFGIGIGYAWW